MSLALQRWVFFASFQLRVAILVLLAAAMHCCLVFCIWDLMAFGSFKFTFEYMNVHTLTSQTVTKMHWPHVNFKKHGWPITWHIKPLHSWGFVAINSGTHCTKLACDCGVDIEVNPLTKFLVHLCAIALRAWMFLGSTHASPMANARTSCVCVPHVANQWPTVLV